MIRLSQRGRDLPAKDAKDAKEEQSRHGAKELAREQRQWTRIRNHRFLFASFRVIRGQNSYINS
jgi:hypothetical protein